MLKYYLNSSSLNIGDILAIHKKGFVLWCSNTLLKGCVSCLCPPPHPLRRKKNRRNKTYLRVQGITFLVRTEENWGATRVETQLMTVIWNGGTKFGTQLVSSLIQPYVLHCVDVLRQLLQIFCLSLTLWCDFFLNCESGFTSRAR